MRRKARIQGRRRQGDCGHDLDLITAVRRAGIIEEALRQHGADVDVTPELRQEYCWRVVPVDLWRDDDLLPDLTSFAAELAVALDVAAVAVQPDSCRATAYTVYRQFAQAAADRAACAAGCVVIIDNPFSALDVALRALDVPAPQHGAYAAGTFTLEYADADAARQALQPLAAGQARLAHLLAVEACEIALAEHESASLMITIVRRADTPGAASEAAAPPAPTC
jgi:hypothetical protein